MWILASIPLWFIGTLLFCVGVYGIVKVAFNETEAAAFKTANDIQALKICTMFVLASAVFLIAAAKIAS
jgi:hypothetical protein